MATVADTISEISNLQKEFEAELASASPLDKRFVEDLMNETSVYFLDLLAHASLERMQVYGANSSDPLVKRYYEIMSQDAAKTEIIRWQHIRMLYSIWGTFEQFIDRLYAVRFAKEEPKFEERHRKLFSVGVDKKHSKTVLAGFKGIHRTRNSLHNGGIYQQGTTDYEFKVRGQTYTLEPGSAIKPIRLMDVIQTMWKHYLEIKANSV